MSERIESDFISWSQAHFNMLAEGGTWAIPRSGLVFQKREGALYLIERMPWSADMPITEERLLKYQDEEFAAVKLNFEKAGISVIEEITVEPKGEIICDFCSATPVRWTYAIPAGHVMGSVGGQTHVDEDGLWGACEPCKALIEARDHDGLLNRSVEQFQKLHGSDMPIALIQQIVATPHSHFWNLYDGHDPAPEGNSDLLGLLIVKARRATEI